MANNKILSGHFLGSEDMEAKLWEYIDGLIADAEKVLVEKLIAENEEWNKKYNELLEIHQSLHLVDLEQPSLRFMKNVMEEIGKLQVVPAAKAYINQKVIWSIGLFFLTMIGSFFIYGFAQIDWSVAEDSKTAFGFNLVRVDYIKMFSNNLMNILMMMNVVLGLLLLDRFLNSRKKQLVKNV